jgi:hypothetical protein
MASHSGQNQGKIGRICRLPVAEIVLALCIAVTFVNGRRIVEMHVAFKAYQCNPQMRAISNSGLGPISTRELTLAARTRPLANRKLEEFSVC